MTKKTENIDWAMTTLGYSEAWLDLGALTDEIATNQHDLFHKKDADQNTEHYRYGAFRAYISEKTGISDGEISLCIQIGTTDPDEGMGSAIVYDLIRLSFLTEAQFEKVAETYDTVSFQRHVTRYRYYKLLKGSPRSEIIWDAIKTEDSDIQRFVLDRAEVSRDVCVYLAEHGQNKAIRNIAKSNLNRRQK